MGWGGRWRGGGPSLTVLGWKDSGASSKAGKARSHHLRKLVNEIGTREGMVRLGKSHMYILGNKLAEQGAEGVHLNDDERWMSRGGGNQALDAVEGEGG